jgi:hypothetical protein
MRLRRLQHGVGLADAGGRAEKDLQPAAPFPGHVIQRGGAWGITHATYSVFMDGELSARVRLSASRLQHADILRATGVKVRYERAEGA